MIEDLLIRHEGLRLKPYTCSAGKLTIGCGRNLDDVGVTREEAIVLLRNDIVRVQRECSRFPWFFKLTQARQAVVMSMVFNMGLTKFQEFHKTIQCIDAGDYAGAADEMIRSAWAIQVGRRAHELAAIMRRGTLN